MGVKEEKVELDGEILEAFGGGLFRIRLRERPRGDRLHVRQDAPLPDPDGSPGEKVKVELSPYDPTRGRIVYRER